MYLAYMIRLITGETPRQLLGRFMDGNIKDEFINLALSTMDRIEASGAEIVVSGVIATFFMEWFRRSIGRKQFIKLGPFRVTA